VSYSKPTVTDFGMITDHTFALQGKNIAIQLADGVLEQGQVTSP
jgi:hypothetical protein